MIHIVAVGPFPLQALDHLAADLARRLRVSCHVRTTPIDAEFAFDTARCQYHATAILKELAAAAGSHRLLGITDNDLFVPILTFVFGEAQLAGPAALVSRRRLHEEFYGLPPDPAKARERVLKEAMHELGHTLGLRHCRDWTCAMASTHSVERLDLKEPRYCDACLQQCAGKWFNGG